jgi:hypothetical protein
MSSVVYSRARSHVPELFLRPLGLVFEVHTFRPRSPLDGVAVPLATILVEHKWHDTELLATGRFSDVLALWSSP